MVWVHLLRVYGVGYYMPWTTVPHTIYSLFSTAYIWCGDMPWVHMSSTDVVDHQFYPVGNVLYPVDKILFILWVTLKLYPVGDILWVTLKLYPVGDILWATLKLYPVGNMSVTYRIYRMLSTGLKMFPTGYHPQDIILSCG